MSMTEQEIRLSDHFQKLLAEQYSPSPVNAKNIAHYLAYMLLASIAGSAGLPILSAAQRFAKGNEALEILYSYGFIASIGALNIWGLFDFIKYSRVSADINPKNSIIKKRFHTIASVTMAVITAAANVPVNFLYNKSIPLTAQGFICDSILLSCTYQRLISSNGWSRLRASSYQKKMLSTMQMLSKRLDIAVKCLINSSRHQQSEFLSLIQKSDRPDSLVGADNTKILIGKLLEISNPVCQQHERHIFWRNGLPRQVVAYLASPLLPVLWAYTSFNAISTGFRKLEKDSSWIFPLTLMPVLLAYALEVILTQKTLLALYDTAVSWSTSSLQHSLPWLLHLHRKLIMDLCAAFTVAFCFSSRAQIAEDFIPSPDADILVGITIGITIIVKWSSLQSLVNDISYLLIRKYGDAHFQDLSKFIYAVEQFQLVNEVATKNQIIELIEDCDPIISMDRQTELSKSLSESIARRPIMEDVGSDDDVPKKVSICSRLSCANLFSFFSNKKKSHDAVEIREFASADYPARLM